MLNFLSSLLSFLFLVFFSFFPNRKTKQHQVCGGFRRGKETLHDVDMLVSFRRGNGEPGHQGFVEVSRHERHVDMGVRFRISWVGSPSSRRGGYGGGTTTGFVENNCCAVRKAGKKRNNTRVVRDLARQQRGRERFTISSLAKGDRGQDRTGVECK